MKRRILQIINEELLREDVLGTIKDKTTSGINTIKGTANNLIDKGKEVYNDNVAPTVDKAKDYYNNKVVPTVNNATKSVKKTISNEIGCDVDQMVGNPVGSYGIYDSIKIPNVTSILDLAKLKPCNRADGTSRTCVINKLFDFFKQSLKLGEKKYKEDKANASSRPYIELTTYDVGYPGYQSSHSELTIYICDKVQGVLNTYVDDSDYSMATNNCSNATFACICTALGYGVTSGFATPHHTMKKFAEYGVNSTKREGGKIGKTIQRRYVDVLQALRGLFYIMVYIDLGMKRK